MDQFQDRIARLEELTADEITALEAEMVAAFDAADASGDVETMQELADALDEVRAAGANAEPTEAPAEEPAVAASAADEVEVEEADIPEAVAEEAAAPEAEVAEAEPELVVAEVEDLTVAQVAEAAAQTAADDALAEAEKIIENAPTAVPADELAADEAAVADSEEVPEAEQVAPTDTQEAVVAEEVTSEDVPEENQPELVTAAAPYTITAGGDIPGFTAGQSIDGLDEVYEALTNRANSMRGVNGEVRSVVASLKTDFDDDKMLRRSDPDGNSEKIRNIVREGRDGGQEALTAAGWCAPKTPIYDHVNGMAIGVTDTPVLDSLPSVGVDRGGITWQPPFALGQIDVSMLGHWQAQDDGSFGFQAGVMPTPGAGPAAFPANNKPCIDIPCPPEAEAELQAIPLCICTDVLMSRANPEFIRHYTDLLMVAQARFKEQWALAKMDLLATVAPAAPTAAALGVARDFLVQLRVAAANFRWENRLSPTQDLRAYLPSWLRDAIAADLAIQMPGDDTISLSYAVVEGYISDLNVSPVWYIDDQTNPTHSKATDSTFDTDQGFAADFSWYLTLPGAMVHLDGGSLDLGVQRTKEDIQQNKFCEFAETFDGLAYMGPDGSAWLMSYATSVDLRGGFAPAVAAAALTGAGFNEA